MEAHPAEVIAEANKARTRLARVYFIPRRTKKTSADGTSSRSSVNLIRDERLPKSPSSAYILFAKSRWATGDLQGMGIRDASRQVAKEWKELPESDRQVSFMSRYLSES